MVTALYPSSLWRSWKARRGAFKIPWLSVIYLLFTWKFWIGGKQRIEKKKKKVMLTIRRKRAETRACSRCRVSRTSPANMRKCYLWMETRHNCFSGDWNRDYVFMLSKRKQPSTRGAICLLIALVTSILKSYLTRSMWSPSTPVWSISSRDSPDFVAWNNQSFSFFLCWGSTNKSIHRSSYWHT